MTRTLPRPTLLPGLRPLWRDRHTIQLGTDPAQAIVLELPHPVAAKVLDLLDGSRTERAIVDEMVRVGLAATEVQALLAGLAEAGLVVAAHTLMPSALPAGQRHRIAAEATALALRFRDRPASPAVILRRRYAARVIIAGDGPFARIIAPALLESGVGTVGLITNPGDTATPIHLNPTTGQLDWPTPRPRSHPAETDLPHPAATRATACSTSAAPAPSPGRRADIPAEGGTRAAAPTGITETGSLAAAGCDSAEGTRQAQAPGGGRVKRVRPVRAEEAFVIRVGRMTRVGVRGARARQPQLGIGVRDGVAIVGPLVPVTGGPCLRCLDLHRTDRDPAWPRLAAQLAEQESVASTATMLTAAGFAVAETLCYLDGGVPSTIATTVEINGGNPWRRRSWTPHPSCGCAGRG